MMPSLSNPADGEVRFGGATPDGGSLANLLGRFGYALLRPIRREMRFREIRGNLRRLDDRVLRDIGLQRWEIGTFARTLADLRWPARDSAMRVLMALAGLAWNRWRSAWERRATIHALRLLDDRLLKDIGIERSGIPVLADRLVRPWSNLVGTAAGRGGAADVSLASETARESRAQRELPLDVGEARRLGDRPANDDRLARAS